ncbi:hypothetical protein OIV83_005597 [Microbotryomycetes sp. JL201]|nr:hypothetical protein OIV83_005597 [Microbotryomycetes sp. JL201]
MDNEDGPRKRARVAAAPNGTAHVSDKADTNVLSSASSLRKVSRDTPGAIVCHQERHYGVDFKAVKSSVMLTSTHERSQATALRDKLKARRASLTKPTKAIDLTLDSDSSLSALSDSDGDDAAVSQSLGAGRKKSAKATGAKAIKANGQAVAAVAAKSADGPASAPMAKTSSKNSTRGRQTKPPTKADPPPCYAFSRVYTTPSSVNLKARLHIRSFVFRFIEQIETLQGTGQKLRMTMSGLADDPIWFFSQNAELGQRHILRGLLELLEGEEQADIMDSRHSWKLMERLIREEADAAIGSSLREVVNQPWDTLREILETEEIWDSFWDKLVVKWEREREESQAPDRDTRHRTGDLSPDAKLALMVQLIEMIYNAESVRQELAEGIEREKTTVVEINKRKTEVRREWDMQRKKILAESGPKPKAKKQLAEWKKMNPDIDERLQDAEDSAEKRMLEAQRDIWVCHSENVLRFGPCGVDVAGNEYYILNRTSRSPFPGTKNVREHDDYPLTWAIIVHGTPFDFGKDTAKPEAAKQTAPAKPTASKRRHDSMDVDGKSGSDAEDDEDDDDDDEDLPTGREFTFTSPAVAEAYEARARKQDAWFLVDPLENGDELADWIEYEAKALDYRDWKREQEEAQPSLVKSLKPTTTTTTKSRGPPAEQQWRDVSELVGAIRSFVDYVQCESEMAEQVKTKKKKARWI